jgi:dihydroflavonol-4-reductase
MILVTGATGLTGAHLLLNLLEKGHPVRAIYRKDSALDKTRNLFRLYQKSELFDKIEWVLSDINDLPGLERAFQGVTKVYHCAALISFDPADETAMRKYNIEGTANIVNLSLAFQIKKLCHVSSVAALGDAPEGKNIISEETDWNPEKSRSDYAITKYGAEMEIWRGQQEGLDVLVINPGIILGPGFWQTGSGKIFSAIKKGFGFYTRGTTGFVDVRDVAEIMVLLMESDIRGERFTVVAQNRSYEDFLKLLALIMKKKMPMRYASPLVTSIFWRADWLVAALTCKKRRMTKEDARALHAQHIFATDKLQQTLNYSFRPLEQSLREIVEIHQR